MMTAYHTSTNYRSTKLWAFIFCSVLIMTAGWTMMADKLANVCLALVTALGIYSGSNVANAWGALKAVGAKTSASPKASAKAKS